MLLDSINVEAMKLTGKIITRALVVLGFGSVVGLASGCSASHTSKSRPADGVPADSVIMRDGHVPEQLMMYGPPRPDRFDRNRSVRERVQ